MRALVTGANGFVGQHLTRRLLERGARVYGTTLSAAPEPGTLTADEVAEVAWLPLDLADAASVVAAIDAAEPEVVFHLAAQSSVAGSFREPLATWEVNATGTVRLLEALRPRGARVVFASSAEVYGPVPAAEQPIGEARPLRPANPYAAAKAAAEMAAVQATLAGGVEVVIARSFNHTGPGQDARFALPSFAAQLAAGEAVLRVGNLSAGRDMLDVRDVVEAYLRLAEAGEAGEAYNVCSGEARPIRAFVDLLVELSGGSARVEVDPARERPVDVPLLLGDAGRIRSLGWAPTIALRTTLADLLSDAGRR